MRWIALFALAAVMACMPARAYTPESGVWWNPAWPGIGMQIELQDNLMSVMVYVYDEDGFPMWYTAVGFVDDSASVFEQDLEEFFGGTCVGCAFRPNTELGPAGSIRIVFDEADPTRAVMTWALDGGSQRTIPIERTRFYLKRQEDGSAPLHTTKMMGEWSATLDFSQNPNNDTGIPFFGDVLVVDRFEFSASDSLWYFDGCRPETSLDGFCTNAALASNDLAGFYDDSVDPGRHVMVVTDTRDNAGNPLSCVLYDVQVGTDSFNGGLDGDFAPNDGGVTVYACGGDPFDGNHDFYPVRGFRSASRTFVEEGVGPSKAVGSSEGMTGQAVARSGLPPARSSKAEPRSTDASHAQRLQQLRALEQRLGVQ